LAPKSSTLILRATSEKTKIWLFCFITKKKDIQQNGMPYSRSCNQWVVRLDFYPMDAGWGLMGLLLSVESWVLLLTSWGKHLGKEEGGREDSW
jgi:hypothetical protein